MADMAGEKPLSRNASIAVGAAVACVGLAIVAVSIFAAGERFHAPRWVVACAGGAFLVFGGWIAAIYARGFDPARPNETLPSAGVQLAVLVPGLVLFAAPFHWVAFGPGPREFSSTFSLPFVSVHRSGGGLSGRIAFGIGAVLTDAMIVFLAVRLAREALRRKKVRAARLPR